MSSNFMKEMKYDSVHGVDEDGLTLLHWAGDRGPGQIAKELIQRGAASNFEFKF